MNATTCVDLPSAEHVGVEFGPHGEVWVNVDGLCRFRVNRAKKRSYTAGPQAERSLDWSTTRSFAHTMTADECRYAARRLREGAGEITEPREDIAQLLDYVADLKEGKGL